ncbi:MAG: hypothetical protein J7L71_10910 [Spirochaetaceae bacterium]|nr:hypothetical protein [Spirochaetaceae bacterium]
MDLFDKSNKLQDWHKLDNTGKIYPLIHSDRQTSLFRLTAVLSEQVDPLKIKKSLIDIMPRFPYFQVVLKPGFFWHYFEKTKSLPSVQEDKHYPCSRHDRLWATHPIHIYINNNKLAVEFSHALTDGYGGTVFLQTLLTRYFDDETAEGTFNLNHPASKEEWEDSFTTHYNPSVPPSKTGKKAYHLPYEIVPPGIYYSTTGILPLKEILAKAKKDGGSLTEWLTAKYIEVIAEIIQDFHWKPAPIVINVPVNLRPLYSSKTLRNFFVTLTPMLDVRVGYFSFPKILAHVKNFMNLQVDRNYISQQFKRNVNLERSIFIRLIPLFLKKMFFPFFYYHLGERQYSGGFSNLGKFSLPGKSSKKVKEIHILVPPSPGTLIKAGCISYGDKLFITFGSLTENKEVERRFFTKLRKEGLDVRIDVNY